MTQGRRLDSLEGLRFLSSLAIVAGHYAPYVGNYAWIAKLHLAVDLFFVISGIVIAERYADRIGGLAEYLDFLRRRFARLYPLHIATFGFYLLIGLLLWNGLGSAVDREKYDPAMIIPNLLMVHAWFPWGKISFNYVSWSISAELLAYVLFPLIAWSILRAGRIGALAAILILTVALALLSEAWLEKPLTKLTWDAGALRAIPSFAFGVWLCRFGKLSGRRAGMTALLHVKLGLIVALTLARVDDMLLLPLIWAIVATALACDRAGLPTLLSRRWLSAHGELTYSIYMLHTIVATIFLAVVFPRLLGTDFEARLAGVLLALPILYACARISLRWFEDPLRRVLADGQRPAWVRQARPAER